MRDTNGLFQIFRWQDKRDGSPHQTLGILRWEGGVRF